MSRRIIELEKPVLRRIGNFTIRITRDAIEVRGRGKRLWRPITWDRVLSLLDSDDQPVLVATEKRIGRRQYDRLTQKRQVRMYVIDAGDAENGQLIAKMQCPKCQFTTGWKPFQSDSAVRRGLPCPKCNGADDPSPPLTS